MQIAGKAVAHAEKWHDVMDGGSLRNIRRIINDDLQDHYRVSNEVEDEEAKADFDEIFAEDVARAEAALKLCDAALEKLAK